jgi:hypothetical protein
LKVTAPAGATPGPDTTAVNVTIDPTAAEAFATVTEGVPTVAVPERVNLCDVPRMLSESSVVIIVPLTLPACVGAKLITSVQLAPEARITGDDDIES